MTGSTRRLQRGPSSRVHAGPSRHLCNQLRHYSSDVVVILYNGTVYRPRYTQLDMYKFSFSRTQFNSRFHWACLVSLVECIRFLIETDTKTILTSKAQFPILSFKPVYLRDGYWWPLIPRFFNFRRAGHDCPRTSAHLPLSDCIINSTATVEADSRNSILLYSLSRTCNLNTVHTIWNVWIHISHVLCSIQDFVRHRFYHDIWGYTVPGRK